MRYCPEVKLPSFAYQPGQPGDSGQRPTRLESLQQRESPVPLQQSMFRNHRGLAFGLDLFNHGFFWEAHEVWEQAWTLSDGSERELLFGLIQLTAAALQRCLGKKEGAARLLQRARGHLAEAARVSGTIFCGIDLDTVAMESLRGHIQWRFRSRDFPGTRSNLSVQPQECRFRMSADGVIQETPTRLDYHSGHAIYIDTPIDAESVTAIADWRAMCSAEFGSDVSYQNVHCEYEGSCPPWVPPPGCKFDQLPVLRAQTIPPSPVPRGVEIRRLESEADWLAVGDVAIEIDRPNDGEGLIPFARWLNDCYRQTIEVRGGDFFGAFVDGELASCLGVIVFDEGFRYQSVQTRKQYRRRGLARATITHAFQEMKARGHAHGVIVAGNENAEHLYLSVGFRQVSTLLSIQFGPKEIGPENC